MTAELVLLTDALVRATPLILAGLAVAIAFRGGVFNIGAEGQLLIGAVAATTIALKFNQAFGALTVAAALAAGAIAGAAWAAIAAELRRRFHVLEIISTIMLNFIAIYAVSLLVRGPLQEPLRIYPQTETFSEHARLPLLFPGTRLHIGFLIAISLAVSLSWFISRSAAGFKIRATGASVSAAQTTGRIRVEQVSFFVFLMSGALAGIAGAIEVCGVTFALYENLSPGYGYTAIAVALIAGLSPIGIIASGLFFGILETGAIALQRELAVPASLAGVVEAALILMVIGVAAVRGRQLIGAVRS